MSSAKRLQFSTVIAAPVERVWSTMLEPRSYEDWTSAFMPGSRYEGSWEQGQRIRFLGPSGEGMLSEIAENRRHAFISIRHLDVVGNAGASEAESAAIRAWLPAYENYTFRPQAGGTELIVDMDVTPDFEQHMQEAWPKALARLKALSETAA